MTDRPLQIGLMLRHIEEPGGITVFTRRIVDHLLTHNPGVVYHLLYRDESQRERFAAREGEHVVLPARSRLIWDQVAVPRYARRAGLDIVFNGKLSVPLTCRMPTVCCIPSGAQFALPWVYPVLDRIYTRVMTPLYCRSAAAIITHTERGRRDLVHHVGADPRRIHVVPHGAHEWLRPATDGDIASLRLEHGLTRPYVLFVGGITPLKNLGGLLRAFADVGPALDLDLVLAGFRRFRFDAEIALIESLNLQDRVRQVGFVPDPQLAALYSGAACFVMPSWYEGFGIPVIEAMACGTPVVCSTGGCLPDVAGGAALMVDPAKPESIAGGIRSVVTDEALRASLVEKGLRHAAHYTWLRSAAAIGGVLVELATAHRERRAPVVS